MTTGVLTLMLRLLYSLQWLLMMSAHSSCTSEEGCRHPADLSAVYAAMLLHSIHVLRLADKAWPAEKPCWGQHGHKT